MAKKPLEIDINVKESDNGFFIASWTEWSLDEDGISEVSDRRTLVSETFEEMMNELQSTLAKRFPDKESEL